MINIALDCPMVTVPEIIILNQIIEKIETGPEDIKNEFHELVKSYEDGTPPMKIGMAYVTAALKLRAKYREFFKEFHKMD